MPIELIVIYTLTILAVTLIGFLVLLQNKYSVSNRAFFGVTLFQALWILSLFFGYYYAFSKPPVLDKSEFYVHLAYGTGLIAMLFLIIFLYVFPRKILKFGRALSSVYICVMISMTLITLFTNLVHGDQVFRNGIYYTDTFGPLYSAYSILLLLSLLLATYIATKKSLILRGLEKRKILYATTGCWFYGFTTIMTNIILPTYGINTLGNIQLIQISPIYVLLFVVPTLYSIYKHRFFNFSYVSFHALRAVIFYAVFLFLTFSLSVAFQTFFPKLDIFLLTGLSALTALVIKEKIQDLVPEFVSEGFREFRKAIRELDVAVLSSESLEQLQNAIEKAFIVQMNFVNAKLYVLRKSGDDFDLPIYQRNAFTKDLKKYEKDMLVLAEMEIENIDETLKKSLFSSMEKLESDFCMPLFSEGKLIGFLALKRRSSDTVYPREEIEEILEIKRGLEITLMNILLKMNLEEENDLMKAIIDEKTKQLKKKVEEVNELLKQQADFIAVTAHEFRTPLAIAIFQLDDILHSKKPAKERLEDLKLVETSIGNLKLLTEKFFAVQQYDLNKVELNLEKTNITTFIDRLFKDFLPIMKDKELHFSLKMDPKKKLFATIDQSQIRQVLHNVLTNASKFTPKGGQVVLSLSTAESEIEIKVDDSGEGIPGDLKKAVFDKFRTANVGAGIGLGLYLCKKILELHKGRIWAEDSDLGGASFRLRLKSVR